MEAGNTLELAIHCCRRYQDDPIMRKLEEYILYQIFRVFIIKEKFADAREIIEAIKKITKNEDNIIFSSLLGYYYRNTLEIDKALEILDKAYNSFKEDEETKKTFPRYWFNTIYQRAFSHLNNGDLELAEKLMDEAVSILDKADYRNLGYCTNLLGNIFMKKENKVITKALDYYQQSYDYFERYNDYRNMARVKRNIGEAFFLLGKYSEASQAYNQSLAYDYRIHADISIARTLLYKFDLRIELLQYYKAEEYISRIKKLKLPKDHHLWKKIRKKEKELSKHEIPEDMLIGDSEAIQKIIKEISRCALNDKPLLILGERGVGKSMIARMIHENSGRTGEFEIINCAAVQASLLESELFGHEKGAFTGADRKKTGRLESAKGGTVFLDEVAELPTALQAKLLHFLEDKIIRPVGGTKDIHLDVRIICATNINLENELGKSFRYDFYDRISGITIVISPLRERTDDIRKLAEYFYLINCRDQNKNISGIEPAALNYLENYAWPGNVRELDKTILRCVHNLDDDHPITKECVLNALDKTYRLIEINKNTHQKPQKTQNPVDNQTDSVITELTERLKKLEDIANNQGGNLRITDPLQVLNHLFRMIQENGPVRKSDIVEQFPDLKKSFHHWAKKLKNIYQVIEEESRGNYKMYKVTAPDILEKSLNKGLLNKDHDFYIIKKLLRSK